MQTAINFFLVNTILKHTNGLNNVTFTDKKRYCKFSLSTNFSLKIKADKLTEAIEYADCISAGG